MDFSKRLGELNIQYAIKGEVRTKLKDNLQILTKERLSLLASSYELPGRSKMKKQDLADALYQHLMNVNVVRAALLIAETKDWELINRLLEAPYVQDDTLYPEIYLFLMGKGLLYSFYNEEKMYFLIPEEIKEAYHSLPQKAFLEDRDRLQLVSQYINASANLYGICPQDKIIEIFNSQNKYELTVNEFYSVYVKISSRGRTWYLERGDVISDYFDYDDREDKDALLEDVKYKPYYIPDKREFLKYAESDYFEKTPQLASLHKYISQHLCKDKWLAESLVEDIQLMCSMEEPIDAIVDEFERRNIRFNTMEQLQAIIPLIIDVYNHTRIWSNRGHTPAELGSSSNQTTKNNNIIYLDQQAVSIKVGRNEPCPCGSGKKYKKCCGQ
ncbi:YecA family protein [Paenibacillus radicis (ex Xue et al. 2023)]|uniref:SEC-C metal-binding domain-containing protein n=1 Tax=Paenibacillus radicis (ex Xue et al. 2023) TaxID=2972489 RepID=A0ABT1YSQ4_9BACL|nr:SEC-C metal-binding domain-containing protein [Paenibacillus radicis (ex Xue et al. 2023)]MCR8636214.1 SEC-C metal-binding domain-containing protein [Paenibacillus radicis (ex Xue et al. 2023)]